jgi:hypothetical protein
MRQYCKLILSFFGMAIGLNSAILHPQMDFICIVSCRSVGSPGRVHGIGQRAGFLALPRTIDDITAILDQEKPDPAKRGQERSGCRQPHLHGLTAHCSALTKKVG